MTVFVVIEKATGNERYRYDSAQLLVAEYPLDSFDHVPLPEGATELPPPAVRRLTKLQFIERLGADFDKLFAASKVDINVEKFVRMIDWATPDPDGTSIDLADPRVITALTRFEQAGLIATGRAEEILNG